jgi:DNA-binding response OmpR family regulator
MGRPAPQRPAEPGWILVADADQPSARRLANHFTRQGFRAYQTPRGEEAVLVANSRRLSLAVIDVALNDMPGTTLAARLKAIEPALPVVMTSNDHRPELEAEARKVGLLFYAHKPTSHRLIGEVVEKALRS